MFSGLLSDSVALGHVWTAAASCFRLCRLSMHMYECASVRASGQRHFPPARHHLLLQSFLLLYGYSVYNTVHENSGIISFIRMHCLPSARAMRAAKLCTIQNPPFFNWRCRLMQVDLYNGRKTVVAVVVVL